MIERILLNIFFVILPFILLPIFYSNNYDKFLKIRKYYIFFSALLASLACMIFTIHIDSLIIFDFRFILQLYASLLLGPVISIVFFIFTVSYEFLFEGQGLLFATIISGLHVILSIFYSEKFKNNSAEHRIFSFTLIHILTGVFASLYLYITNGVQHSIELLLWFLAQAFAAFIVIFFWEYVCKNLILQSRLVHMEKMDIVSHLAASISHEVRNPLTTVRGFLQLLSKMKNSNKSKEYIKISIDELDRAEAIISEYLTFAKPSENKIKTLDIKNEFSRMIEIMRPLANQYNVEIKANLQENLYILGEQQSLQQCFINIIKNSIEAMNKDGGTLSIKTSLEYDRILIKINDNGVGMTKQQLSRIGEPYFSTKGSQGTGLGMMVVFKIVELMQGSIDISSECGKGTEITVTFPLAGELFIFNEVAITDV
ncbi:MAG TPA: two-component sensor histidine kinase [Bacillus bacterium]|nr:two-component sensor histidine kinase [Bacillus sp. (in: firmicutes)]